MTRLVFTSNSPEETEEFAEGLSLIARPGQMILLEGDVGSGKSTLARALIKAMAPGTDFDVPSPSFALIQSYANTRIPIAHVDLYRLKSEADVAELGLGDMVSDHLVIVEWPLNKMKSWPVSKLTLHLSGGGSTRQIAVDAEGAWIASLDRHDAASAFLSQAGWGRAARIYLDGDASSRRYERLTMGTAKALLMDMPAKPDGPPVRDGKSYGTIAHLAENIRPVIAINDYLASQGYGAAQVLACDGEQGFAVIEDFGDAVYGRLWASGFPMDEPLRAAVDVLADMASRPWPKLVPLRSQGFYEIPPYDKTAQLIEVDLLLSWFFPYVHNRAADAAVAEEFYNLWQGLLPLTVTHNPVWVLRDFHSPNLIWRAGETGLKRVGLIDTQDALLGHPAYDLMALLQDARLDVPPAMVDQLYAHYILLRQNTSSFDADNFALVYAILGAQRTSKILGIFARLAKRDGKPGYLRHMPRVSRYLKMNLDHPALGDLRQWFQRHLPEALSWEKP